jgi:hypothetical protein
LGFLTDSTDAEWVSVLRLSAWPVPSAADSLSIRFDGGDTVVEPTLPTTPQTGSFVASINLVPWDSG